MDGVDHAVGYADAYRGPCPGPYTPVLTAVPKARKLSSSSPLRSPGSVRNVLRYSEYRAS
ncbi:hypothetical protein vnz_06790 [Streptomyces venezuelae]|nr:hypothetical protein vnz_06790 [Streptomyces venezuelae]